ncbi:aspartate kinase, partial [Vibrio natriegens]
YYLTGGADNLNQVLYKAEKRYPKAAITGRLVAMISAIGANINTNEALRRGMQALMQAECFPIAAHSSVRNVNVQFVVDDNDYQ